MRDGRATLLRWVFELLVAADPIDFVPTIAFQPPDDFPAVHFSNPIIHTLYTLVKASFSGRTFREWARGLGGGGFGDVGD